MANNYCQGSETFEFTDPSHKAWFEIALEEVSVFWDDSLKALDEDRVGWREVTADDDVESEYSTKRFRLETLENYSGDDAWGLEYLGFDYDISDTGIWFYGEENINIERVADLMHMFFKENNIHDQCFTMECASTCSKPRVGEFGGGAVFVTSGAIEGMSTYEWTDRKKEEFRSSRTNA